MKILLYNPDNGVTRNFMPHLWMFLLQSLTPPGHEVLLIDGNAQPMDEDSIARYVHEHNIGLVGIGAMTRMIAKAYHMADAVRAAGVPVVMGGPHVTELADEALGRGGGKRHADAVALGEADETWPKIVEDAARGKLKDVYAPVDEFGQERKPTLQPYPKIPWDSINLDQFNLVPKMAAPLLRAVRGGWGTFRIIPVESGRGCPYGCEFCTVTGFFGDSRLAAASGSELGSNLGPNAAKLGPKPGTTTQNNAKRTNQIDFSSRLCKQGVAGSIPATSTNFFAQ